MSATNAFETSSRRFIAEWTIWSVLGWVVGLALSYIFYMSIFFVMLIMRLYYFSSTNMLAEPGYLLFAIVIAGSVGICLGRAQAFSLDKSAPHIAESWVTATSLGWVLAIIAGSAFSNPFILGSVDISAKPDQNTDKV